MKITSILRVLVVSLFLLFPAISANAGNEMVYVWSFTDRSFQKDDLTDKFTSDFETALAKCSTYRILERRQIDQLLAQAENEKAVTDASQFSNDFRNALKAKSAEMVVFGTVFDDKESGQYNITVTFEDFGGEKKLIKSCLIPRGKVHDATSRTEAMENLVKSISERTASVVEINSRDLVFQLISCTISNNTVIFKFLLTNNGNDNDFVFRCGFNPRPKVWDNFGNTAVSDQVTIANHSSSNSVGETLISGVPVVGEWIISGLSPKATSIPRFDIWYHDDKVNGDILVTFRNIKIQR